MATKYNPFTDALDFVGGGGTSYIDGDVEYHSNLPVTVGSPAVNSAFLVRKGEGLYFVSRKPAGIWVRELNNGNLDDWKYAGTFSDLYRDANFRILNNTDITKELAFDVSGVTTETTRTLTVPDKSGKIVLQNTSTGTIEPTPIVSSAQRMGSIDLGGDAFGDYRGGLIVMRGDGADGGTLNLSDGGGSVNTSLYGGSILTYGVDAATFLSGGSIITYGGGGSINTRGTGSIELGVSGTRTTLTGTATADRAISLPNASGRIQVEGQPIGNTTPSSGAFTTLSAAPTSGSALTLTGGTVTASAPVLDASQTWNASGTTFTGMRFVITNTASDHRSLLFSLDEGATPSFGVQSIIGVPIVQATRLFGGSRGLRFGARATGATGTTDFCAMRWQTNVFSILHGVEFGWSSLPYDTAPDLALHRDAADTLAQRRTTNAQTFRLYSTFTSATSFERLNLIAQTGGSFIIGTEKGSAGGTARGLEFRTDGTARINISSTGGIGFYGAAASAQPAAVADATDAATTQARLNDLLARLRTLGLIAT